MFYKRLGYFLLGVGVASIFLQTEPLYSLLIILLGNTMLNIHNSLLPTQIVSVNMLHDAENAENAMVELAKALQELAEDNE